MTCIIWGVYKLPDKRNYTGYRPGRVLLIAITLWAKLGNILLHHNRSFLQEDAFYIGLVENGTIPQWSLMILDPAVFFLAVLAFYGLCHALRSRTKAPV